MNNIPQYLIYQEKQNSLQFKKWSKQNQKQIDQILSTTINFIKNIENDKNISLDYNQLSDEFTKLIYKTSYNSKKNYVKV